MSGRLLILGGTTEAADLARRLCRDAPNLAVITSLAGRTEKVAPAGQFRVGGFGGADGLEVPDRGARVLYTFDRASPSSAQRPA